MEARLTLADLAKKDSLMAEVLPFFSARDEAVYLVGGYLRDVLLPHSKVIEWDIDFAVMGNAARLARAFADARGYSFFVLDERLGTARVVVKTDGQARTIDFAKIRGDSIEDDLRRRDFTIDALALDMRVFLEKGRADLPADLIDPTGGWPDLKNRLIRAVSDLVFPEDPVRLLRLFRLQAQFDFTIDARTLKLARANAHLAAKPPGERMQEELASILTLPKSALAFDELAENGLIEAILPELGRAKGVTQDRFHHLDVWGHSFFALNCLEEILSDLKRFFPGHIRAIMGHIDQELQAGVSRRTALKLAALLHDVGKPEARFVDGGGRIRFFEHQKMGAEVAGQALRRLRLAERPVVLVQKLIREHLRPGFLAEAGGATEKAISRLLRDMGDSLPELALLSVADRMAMRGEASTEAGFARQLAVCRRLVREHFGRGRRAEEMTPLVDGHDLMRELDLQPGKIVGILLVDVREAQLKGQVTTRKQAFLLAKQLLRKNK